MNKSNLSRFLHAVIECKKDDCYYNGTDLVKQLLLIQGINYYGEEKQKSIYTGSRPIVPSDIEANTKKDRVHEFKKLFFETVDPNKVQLLFSRFDIDKDDKVDLTLMCEAMAMQYQNFTRYGDLANTTVKSIYEVLIDSKGYAADPDANQKAINAAYELLMLALDHLCKVNPVLEQISNVKEPIENFLMTITQVYSVLFARMNRIGRISYKSLREKHIRKNSKSDKYIKMASEPGALPIELKRGFHVVAYDMDTTTDYHIGAEGDLREEYTKEDLIDGLESIEELKGFIEINFTEYTHYHLANEKDDIVDNIYYLAYITKLFLSALSHELSIKVSTETLDTLKSKYENSQRLSIAFAFDGSYYRPTKTITYAVTIENILFDDEGNGHTTGDSKFSLDVKQCFFRRETFKETFEAFSNHEIKLYQSFTDDPMNEIIVINADRTYRYYMFVNTCKAKTYRKIREIANQGIEDHAVAVLIQNISVVHFQERDKLLLLPSQERVDSPGGIDVLTTYGATWDKIVTRDYKGEDLKKNIIKEWSTKTIHYLYKPFTVMLIGNRGMGYSYTSVFKDKEKPINEIDDNK